MEIPWVEGMVSFGTISENVRDEIYSSCDQMVKEASTPVHIVERSLRDMSPQERMDRTVKQFAPFGLNMVVKAINDYNGAKSDATSMLNNRGHIASEFKENEAKALARFDEIAEIAPSVAANKSVVTHIIRSKIKEGLTTNDVMNLASLQAQQLPNLGSQSKRQRMYSKQREKNASAIRLGEMCADVYQMGKVASVGLKNKTIRDQLWKALKTTAMVSSVPILAGLGSGAVSHYMGKKNKEELASQLNRSFAEAMRTSDPNKEPLHVDKAKSRQAFETLAHFAPNVAAEPSAARSFMNKIVSYDQGVDIGSVKELSEIERNLGQANKEPNFVQGFRAGADATGLQAIVSGGVKESLKPTQTGIGRMLAGLPKDPPPKKGNKGNKS